MARTKDTTGTLKVTQVRSTIGAKPKARGTIRALGLGRIGATNTLPDRPEIRGMLAKVRHHGRGDRRCRRKQGEELTCASTS